LKYKSITLANFFNLRLQVEQLQQKIITLEKTNILLSEKMTSLKNENSALRIEIEDLKKVNENLENEHKAKIEVSFKVTYLLRIL
jgi:hypothetical protein